MQRLNVEFCSEGVALRGWLYLPEARAERPAIVMTHGFSGVKEQYLDRYAEVFAAAGFVVLLYDHPNFGDSDGEPRQEIDPVMQRRGYRDAITWLGAQARVDASRIGIWGTSYSGGHVLEVAALDRRGEWGGGRGDPQRALPRGSAAPPPAAGGLTGQPP
ncbi:alpha/beta hydrolase, partial [Pseudomonas aeruginosa]|uniref:alpha/beta hydrolase n=1 Tax=Pseudomonas aeruginosa TaxID=287 RepID=UPI00211B508F